MLGLLALLATASCAIAAPFDIANLASPQVNAVATDSLGAAAVTWKRVVTEAAWSARAGGNLEFNPVTQKFILHGVGIYDDDDEALEEVWIGTTPAGKFTKVTIRTPFEPLYSAISFQDINGVQYRIQGSDQQRSAYPDVYRSADEGKNWVAQHTNTKSRTQLEGTRYLGAGVALVSNPATLLVWGGQASYSEILSDVWRSTDAGINWKFVVDTEPVGKNQAFGPRSVNVGLATTMAFEGETIDVVYQMMGYIRNDAKVNRGVYTNDIWISTGSPTSIGSKWHQIQSNAPWMARGDAQADMTSNGVLIVSSGLAGYASDETENILNDVWASLDGGYSWGLCHKDAEFSDRTYTQAAIDELGHLWIMGGRDEEGRKNDIWKSVESYNDVSGVARQCNLLVPSCGVGLKCLPTSLGFKTGLWGVACDACPNGPLVPSDSGETPVPTTGSSTSGMSSMWTVAFVIVVIVAVGAAAAAYHFYRKSTTSATDAAGQTWWGKDGTSSLVGADSAAPSDAMYNPLNIRDSNATM
jgi:hypothetical protein